MFSSIRVKLTVWYICVLAILIAVFVLISYSFFVSALRAETDENLDQMSQTLASSIKGEQNDGEYEQTADELVKEALDEFRFRDYQFAVFANNDAFIAATTAQELPSDLASLDQERYGIISLSGEMYRVQMSPFSVQNRDYKLYTIHSLEDDIAVESRIRKTFYLTVPLLLLLAGLGGFLLARTSLRPIAAIGERAKKISSANLSDRLPVANGKDEIGSMAVVFNELLDRLDRDFDRQKRFMADASHELRTPVAIIRGESEVALSNDSRDAYDYQQSLNIVHDESKRLAQIVDDLFILARADSNDIKPHFQPLYVDDMLGDCVRAIRTIADKKNITIDLAANEMPMNGDEALLRRLFLNLLDNAVKYNDEGGRIEIVTSGRSVVVCNSGAEIPVEQQKLIFERFHRVEQSRSKTEASIMSGAGLGLSIAKRIADLHHAEIAYSRNNNAENIFTVKFAD